MIGRRGWFQRDPSYKKRHGRHLKTCQKASSINYLNSKPCFNPPGQRYVTSNKSREEHFPLPILELVTTTIARRTRPANPKSKKTRVSHIKQKTAIASVKSHIVTVNETTSRRHDKKRDVALTVDKHDQELDPARQQGIFRCGSIFTRNLYPLFLGLLTCQMKGVTNKMDPHCYVFFTCYKTVKMRIISTSYKSVKSLSRKASF